VAFSPASEVVTFAEFQADLRARELRRLGAKVKLPDQSFQVLAMLLEHPGELVTREEIRKRLWPGDTFVDFDHGLNNAVNRLREALEDSADSPRWIETLHRRGYRFISVVNGGSLANGVVSEARPTAADPEQNGVDAVSVLRAEKPKYRNYRWLLWAAPAIVVVALLIPFELQKAPVVPSSRAFVLPPDDTTFNLIGDNGGSVALSADGGSLAFVAVNRNGSALIWVRSLGKLLAEPLEGTEGATFPFWSRDGHWIAFFADGKLKKISLDGSSAVTLCDAPFGRGRSWNRDGVMIFAPASHGGIYKIPDSGGGPWVQIRWWGGVAEFFPKNTTPSNELGDCVCVMRTCTPPPTCHAWKSSLSMRSRAL
jgi:DNA-binding winged helix-turn-helix (wHTH) protein